MTTSSGAPAPRLLGQRLQDLPVRRLTVADLAACSDLAESRGWGREQHKWRLLLTTGQGYGIDAPDRPGALIGTCVVTSYPGLPGAVGEAGPDSGPEAAPRAGSACIGMMLVAARCARQGLGRRLMEHAMHSVTTAGDAVAAGSAAGDGAAGDAVLFLSATENGRPLYERLGFLPAGTVTSLTGRFRIPAGEPSGGRAGTAPYVRTATASDLAAVRSLDGPVFGADRTTVLLRLPQFADRFVVAESGDGSLAGFAAAWPNGPRTTVVGPVIARDTETAEALIRDLGLHAPGEVRLDIDARHEGLATWARRHGLDGRCLCTLMVRSGSALPGDNSRRFAPCSVALG
ncbi:hypothetical protein DB35_03195 [Streptomyces abyssalis]|uniref:N-acetyltransferase domain-containing protein n=1 Tax=Streptomyces abyssalis TaxID=933944 RepID=A0A1E7JPW1_9ACTN|nr:GNAT family N-acetyltransferase [Streptomyces abyssalis]OEU90296.1 hypothetical protein AN215_12315 [Streptomyces abyssalis]OEU95032.1 hypothetical protein DB35_03195 [Streptomyces abyssalis]